MVYIAVGAVVKASEKAVGWDVGRALNDYVNDVNEAKSEDTNVKLREVVREAVRKALKP